MTGRGKTETLYLPSPLLTKEGKETWILAFARMTDKEKRKRKLPWL